MVHCSSLLLLSHSLPHFPFIISPTVPFPLPLRYGAPPHDEGYLHWTHSVLPHWTPEVTARHRKDPYVAPGDPGVTFHPHRPLYSSHDPEVLHLQMQEMASMLVDVVVVSWWGAKHKNTSIDGQGVGSDHCMPAILDAAEAAGLQVAIHMEPYPLRSEHSVHDDLKYLIAEYGKHPAFYRHPVTGQGLVYAYDSYHMTKKQWQTLLTFEGKKSIRDTPLDCIFLGLVLDSIADTVESGFDGAYSYFAADGFSQAATHERWPSYVTGMTASNMLFVPAVAPGYDDTRLRPWNGVNKRPRKKGEYYRNSWKAAMNTGVKVISLTSYNEWGEGSQVEPARVFTTNKGERLPGYGETETGDDDGQEMMYVRLTTEMAKMWKEGRGGPTPRHGELR